MSRSRRSSAIAGITTAHSEKLEKRWANRRVRRVNRARLRLSEDEAALVHHRELGDPWTMAKDGKASFDPDRHPSLMRK